MRFILFSMLLLHQSLVAQEPYNHRLENDQIQAIGHLVHELDDSYLGIGRGIDTIDFLRGIYATEIDKESGEILNTDKVTYSNSLLFFNHENTIIEADDKPYFLFKRSDTIYLSTYSSIENKIKIEKAISSKDTTNSLFILDFLYKNNTFYIVSKHYTPLTDVVIFKYSFGNDSLQELFVKDIDGGMSAVKVLFLENGNMLLSYTIYDNGAVQYLKEIDTEGNTLWKYNNEIEYEGAVRAFLPIGDHTYILGGIKGRESADPDGEGIPYLFKFDYNQKEIIARSDFDIPDDEWFKWNSPVEEIVPSHDSTAFLCVAELYDFPLNPDTLKSYGMIAKVDHDLDLIWRRAYAYIDGEYFRHDFEDIIATSDGNYLAYGTSVKTFTYPGEIPILSWAIKIDEDGKIVGDTTTATVEWEDIDLMDAIEIFPNPASDHIYINQNDIDNVHYNVYDLHGRLIDEFTLADKNQSVVKSVQDWQSGYHIIRIERDGRLIGSMKVIKE